MQCSIIAYIKVIVIIVYIEWGYQGDTWSSERFWFLNACRIYKRLVLPREFNIRDTIWKFLYLYM